MLYIDYTQKNLAEEKSRIDGMAFLAIPFRKMFLKSFKGFVFSNNGYVFGNYKYIGIYRSSF